jgi:KDO2-lipid IV(A) lauroyltransferase
MARNPSFATRWAQYIPARVAAMLLTMFEPETNLRTAAAAGRLMHRLDKRHRVRGARAIAMAFPELADDEVERLNVAAFEHFVQLAVEVMHTPRVISADSWPNHCELGDFRGAIEILNAGRAAIMLTGHVGNWEVLGSLASLLSYPLNAVARPIDNPLINDWLLGIRERRGMKIITKWNATDRMVDVLDTGGILAFIADQNAGDRGLFVPFFGKLASTYKSVGLLAMQQQVPIICGVSYRLPTGFRYRVESIDVIEPADWAGRRDPLYYITARFMRAIEMMVRRAPAQYFWIHRRWKSRPRYERQGKPMPDALRRNLEELPWMTEALLKSVQAPVPKEIANPH